MRSTYTVALVALSAVLAVGIGRTAVSAQAQKNTWSGIFTADQATKGKAVYDKSCAECHGPALKGGDQGPPLTGEDFIGHWYDAQLSELAGKIGDTMPANAPSSLKPAEYSDVLAFLLQSNGFPAGSSALSVDPMKALEAIKISKTK